MDTYVHKCPQIPEVLDPPEVGVTVGCEPSNMGTGNRTQVQFSKGNMDS